MQKPHLKKMSTLELEKLLKETRRSAELTYMNSSSLRRRTEFSCLFIEAELIRRRNQEMPDARETRTSFQKPA